MLSGVLAENAKLPSVRELAVKLTITPNTIQRAYRELEAEGYIVSIPGKGSFVASNNSALEARKAELREKFLSAAAELRAAGVTGEYFLFTTETKAECAAVMGAYREGKPLSCPVRRLPK